MRHWCAKFISTKYGKMACSEFVEHVLSEQFNINYSFPQSSGSVFNQSKQIKENLPLYCERTDQPKDGDLVLMHGLRRLCHVGMYVEIMGTQYVLHAEKKMGRSALHRFKDLITIGYSVEGVYSWRK